MRHDDEARRHLGGGRRGGGAACRTGLASTISIAIPGRSISRHGGGGGLAHSSSSVNGDAVGGGAAAAFSRAALVALAAASSDEQNREIMPAHSCCKRPQSVVGAGDGGNEGTTGLLKCRSGAANSRKFVTFPSVYDRV